MNRNPKRYNHRSIRLKQYDYTQPGAYLISICTQDHIHLIGEITKCQMNLNPAGEMVNDVWHEIPTHYSGIEIDAFVIMPNHIHGIIILIEDPPVGADPCVRPKSGQPQGVASTLSLPEAVHRFTTKTTKRYVDGVKYSDWPPYIKRLWQRNYWEHVIRSERALDAVRRYIAENPQRWDLDRCNAKACGADRLAKGLWQTISETLIQSFKGTPVCTSGTQPG